MSQIFLNILDKRDWNNSIDQIQKLTESPIKSSLPTELIMNVSGSIKSTREYPFTLSWSHYLILMRIESDEERRFYEIESQKQNWSVRQLQRQYNSSLYERLALSKDKDSVLRLAQEGQTINKPDDIIKNPLTLFSNHCSIIYTKNYGQFVMF